MARFGIWNSIDKRFVYGISEPSKKAAWKKFVAVYPCRFIPYRYSEREIPSGFINPNNNKYRKR